MPTYTQPTWKTSVADVQKRLSRLNDVMTRARTPDGSVELTRAKALAGTDAKLAGLVQQLRTSWERTELSPAEAQRAFLELQVATRTAGVYDTDGDAALGFRELAFFDTSDDLAKQLVHQAAIPVDTADGVQPKIPVTVSLEARREAEKVVVETARFHAATPLGAEALAWSMRLRVLEGYRVDRRGGAVYDAVNYSEKDWRAKLPFIGHKFRGKGHLSDAELTARFGDLAQFVAKTREAVNARLLMSYEDFLAGRDLP